MKKILLLLILVVSVFGFCGNLTIKGSNTILPIAQLWAEEFKKLYPDINISLEGAGSSTGIAGLENGITDIANSSRDLKKTEIIKMKAAGKNYRKDLFAYDAIAIIVNKNLEIDNITTAQLKDIYLGRIKTWKELNPKLPDKKIIAYSRNSASGTFEVFNDKVLKNEKMAPHIRLLESGEREVENISMSISSIGYVGLGYVTNKVKVLKVNGVAPLKDTIISGKYLLSRELFMFSDSKNQKIELKKYLEFVFSEKGQSLVKQAGFISLK